MSKVRAVCSGERVCGLVKDAWDAVNHKEIEVANKVEMEKCVAHIPKGMDEMTTHCGLTRMNVHIIR